MSAPTTPIAPPATLPVLPADVPSSLRRSNRWVGWRWEWRPSRDGADGKFTKVPVNPLTGRNADTTRPATWSTFDDAIEAMGLFELAGIGYVLGADPDEIATFGIDLDDCRDVETGELADWALATLAHFPGCYAEPSPRGTGLHIVGYTDVGPHEGSGNKRGPVECYWRDRFFTVTGRPLRGYEGSALAAGVRFTEALADWHARTFPPADAAPLAPPPALGLDDEAVLANARKMARFPDLWAGGGEDASVGDLTMMNELVAAGATDPAQLDRLMRASGRMRAKWDGRRGQLTYGERTIAKALNGQVVPFAGFRRAVPVPPQGPPPGGTAENGLDIGKPQDAATGEPAGVADDIAALKAEIRRLTAELEAERAARLASDAARLELEQRVATLSAVQSRTAGIIRNKSLGQARFTGIAAVHWLACKVAAGAIGPDGLVPAPLSARDAEGKERAIGIAEAGGVSPDTAAKHLEELAKIVPIRREVRWVPERLDPATGRIEGGVKRAYLGLAEGATVVDLAAALARAAPAPNPNKKGWGGARIACPDHPNAGTVKRWTEHCAECDRVLDRGEEHQAPPADAPETGAAIGKPQDAATGPARNRGPSPSVAPVLLSASDATSHNIDQPEWDERPARARADLLARRVGSPNGHAYADHNGERMAGETHPPPPPPRAALLPGMAPPPADRWTG